MLAEPVLYWNHVGLELNRLSATLNGPQGGPTLGSRALGLLHLALHDAYFAIKPLWPTYLNLTSSALRPPPSSADADQAMAGAALAVLGALYARRSGGISLAVTHELAAFIDKAARSGPTHVDTVSKSYDFGQKIGVEVIYRLGIQDGEPGADPGYYHPKPGRWRFRDEPSHPVRRVPRDPDHPERGDRAVYLYHAPDYGMTAAHFAVQANHVLQPHPKDDVPGSQQARQYLQALREVRVVGGAALQTGTIRSPDQTVAALFWAYDGARLIGTPPRLYNQIIRQILWQKKDTNPDTATAEFVRLLALANVAMADAGIVAWREKYKYELWRPLSGIREHDLELPASPGAAQTYAIDKDSDPFWLPLGAPDTNSHLTAFKPPFPAYPSGHATFGAAAFQMVRLFYQHREAMQAGKPASTLPRDQDRAPDDIEFAFTSEELNGISRDLDQPYDPALPIEEQPGLVRTRIKRCFPNLWYAIFENAISRIYLGVHWNYDAFAPEDAVEAVHPDGSIVYKHKAVSTSQPPKYQTMVGGVPLGLAIAEDIFYTGMRPSPLPPSGETPDPATVSGGPSTSASPAPVQALRRAPALKSTDTNLR